MLKRFSLCLLSFFCFFATPVFADSNELEEVKRDLVERGFDYDMVNALDDVIMLEIYNDKSIQLGGTESVDIVVDNIDPTKPQKTRGILNSSKVTVTRTYYTKTLNGEITKVFVTITAKWHSSPALNLGEVSSVGWVGGFHYNPIGGYSTSLISTLTGKNMDNYAYTKPTSTGTLNSARIDQKLNNQGACIMSHTYTLNRDNVKDAGGTLKILPTYAHVLLPTGTSIKFNLGNLSVSFSGLVDYGIFNPIIINY